ncbi:MAG TPA: GDP-mannose 4,6-dehydratase [Leptospiraceae bacterium]|nr:GDP-mannose 4,6-dehydratase [Spirochaetaceae bacterium]HBS05361.1 GDP-mannose 4,6-dehydratase [Leptospiraceae bacterium]
MARALITGAAGQDGYFLSRLLKSKGYEVHGLDRPGAEDRMESIEPARRWNASLLDDGALRELLSQVSPDEIYHLAAFSFVLTSADQEKSVLKNNLEATHSLLSASRELLPSSRFCFAGSAEVFGNPDHSPQSESSAIRPVTVYGVTKAACQHLMGVYRQQGYFACTATLFNHESSRRSGQFVTQKIVKTAIAIQQGKASEIRLGSMDAVRDWGYAGDYVEAMWRMLQGSEPRDYVIATGHGHTVQDFAELVFTKLGLNLQDWLIIDPELVRPPEAFPRIGDASRIKEDLGWQPVMSFEDLVDEMVQSALHSQ